MSNKSNKTALMGGLIIGSSLGTVLGLLIAPRTGRETRQILKKSADALPQLAEDLSTSVQQHADRLSESALRNWDETLLRLKEAISAGIEASQLEANQLQNSTEINADSQNTNSHL